MFTKTITALAVAATLGFSMTAAQARDFDHRGHGFHQAQHHGYSRHEQRREHHRGNEHRFGRHDGRR